MLNNMSRFFPPSRLLLRVPQTAPALSVFLIHPSRRSHTRLTADAFLKASHPGSQKSNSRTSTNLQIGRMRFSHVPERLGLSQGLLRDEYDAADCLVALNGERLPLNLGNDVVRLCVVRGIRNHIAFARSPEVTELALLPGQEVLTRARNASLIMNDEVPPEDAMRNDTYPYCIWYPIVAKEETYRMLAQRYPAMRYQVGRACAVAGYAQLYREFNLLPDVSIAEEARENRGNPGAQEIFASIMAAPMRYHVMDDYKRTIHLDNPKAPAFLNANTAVSTTLSTRQIHHKGFTRQTWAESETEYGPADGFNITEDWGIDIETVPDLDSKLEAPELTPKELALFNSPLPFDLPTMNKTLLILCAAANGDVDRYSRLRRQWRLPLEHLCLIRGCYHSTAMATWLAKSPDVIESLRLEDEGIKRLWRAIHARRFMDGIIYHLLDPSTVPDNELPYWIWYPRHPNKDDILEVAKARPAMRPQCLRACIAAGYPDTFDKVMDLDPSMAPDFFTMRDAEGSVLTRYRESILRRKESLGLEHLSTGSSSLEWSEWKSKSPYWDADMQLRDRKVKLRDTHWELHDGEYAGGEDEFPYGFYEGYDLSLDRINLCLSMSEDRRKRMP